MEQRQKGRCGGATGGAERWTGVEGYGRGQEGRNAQRCGCTGCLLLCTPQFAAEPGGRDWDKKGREREGWSGVVVTS